MAKCTYLGLKGDPKTALSFASEWNLCHHAEPAASPNLIHQDSFCLCDKHTSCPVFLLSEKKPLPKTVTTIEEEQSLGETDIFKYVGFALLLLAAVLVGFLVTLGNTSPTIVESKAFNPQIIDAPILFVTRMPNSTVISYPTLDTMGEFSAPLVDLVDCTPPDGWILYTVEPSDSIMRLKLIYGISETELKSANCRRGDKFFQPGDQIYVPAIITSTPKPTPTNTPRPQIYFPPTATREERHNPPPPATPTSIPVPTDTPPPPPTDTAPVVPTTPPEPPTPTSPPLPTP